MIADLLRALRAGEELTHAETWKRAQLWTASLTALLGAAVSISGAIGHPVPLTGEQITTLVSAVAVLVGVFNTYATIATTTRLGLPAGPGADDAGAADGSGHAAVPRRPEEWARGPDDGAAGELSDVDRGSAP